MQWPEFFKAHCAFSWSALARATGLSVPAVTERVKRLQECGAITAFGARVEAARVGYGVTVMSTAIAPRTIRRLPQPASQRRPRR